MSDSAGAHEPRARCAEVKVCASKGRRACTETNVRIRERSVGRATGGEAEHQVVEVGVLAGDSSSRQRHGKEVREWIFCHRHLGERFVELSEAMVDNCAHEL